MTSAHVERPDPAINAREMRALITLALPIVLVQVGLQAMGIVDTLMAGHVSADVLAAAALGNLYFFNAGVLGMGTLMALDPLVSQAMGAGDTTGAALAVRRGLRLAALATLLTVLLLLPARPLLEAFHQSPAVIGPTVSYLRISMAGVPAFFAFIVFRQSLQAMHRVAPVVWSIVIANILNVGLNWVFLYGHLGSPALGAPGSALATTLARWAMAIGLLIGSWKDLRPMLTGGPREPPWAGMRRLIVIGAPIGFQQALEFGAFGTVGVLMGALGATEMAAHQVALSMAALTFMVPMGIGAAASVRVGHAIGAGDQPRAKAAARAAYISGVGFMCLTALAFLAFPRALASRFTDDAGVIAVTVLLVPIAGIFQVFDGAQAVGAGVLRGLGDTRVPVIMMLAGYWLVGIPLSWYLGFRTELRAAGLWWGFVASLGGVALFLAWRVKALFAGRVERL